MTDVRPIDANALIRQIKETFCTDCNSYKGIRCRACNFDDSISAIDDCPTLDYAPVRHGEWVWNGFDGTGWECSLCEHEESKEAKKPEASYCPNCGAKMDGGK